MLVLYWVGCILTGALVKKDILKGLNIYKLCHSTEAFALLRLIELYLFGIVSEDSDSFGPLTYGPITPDLDIALSYIKKGL